MTNLRRWVVTCVTMGAIGIVADLVEAHGIVGDRFFPATVTTDDPLVADELALPSVSFFNSPSSDDAPGTQDITVGFEFDKLILPKLSFGVSDDYQWQRPPGGPTAHGWDNVTLHIKYEVWRSEPHEAIISVGLETELGGTGSQRVGRSSFSTFTPTFYFGKGFGDLPDSLPYLKPIALTGTLGLTLPTDASDPNALEWGLALEYSLPYLQQQVKDIGLPEPFRSMIPLVEFSGLTPLNRDAGATTGTINPGILWESKYFQLGVEALIPVNGESGNHVGCMFQLQIYIDDLLPKMFGHPLFGE